MKSAEICVVTSDTRSSFGNCDPLFIFQKKIGTGFADAAVDAYKSRSKEDMEELAVSTQPKYIS